MRKLVMVLLVVLTLAYPVAVYLAIGHVAPHWLALMMVALAILRAWSTKQGFWWVVAAGVAVLAVAAAVSGSALPVKLYPVIVNTVMLAVFGYSLFHPPSIVERIARLQEPDLPASGVAYTRKVTAVWCVFFVCNGAAAAYTAFVSTQEVWALYNGLIAYLLMGSLMGGEWCVRQWVRRSASAAV